MSNFSESHVEDAALDWLAGMGWFVGVGSLEEDGGKDDALGDAIGGAVGVETGVGLGNQLEPKKAGLGDLSEATNVLGGVK